MRRKERERLQRIHFREITGRTKSPGCSSPRSCPKRILSWTVGRHLCSLVPLPTTAGLGGGHPYCAQRWALVLPESQPNRNPSFVSLCLAWLAHPRPCARSAEPPTCHTRLCSASSPTPTGEGHAAPAHLARFWAAWMVSVPLLSVSGAGGEFLRGETTIRLRPEAKSFRQRYIARRWTFS